MSSKTTFNDKYSTSNQVLCQFQRHTVDPRRVTASREHGRDEESRHEVDSEQDRPKKVREEAQKKSSMATCTT